MSNDLRTTHQLYSHQIQVKIPSDEFKNIEIFSCDRKDAIYLYIRNLFLNIIG